jgi:hypothetical protein
MLLYASLREKLFARYAEAFIRALDAEIWDAYQKDAITQKGACRLVAERIRAAKLGLPQPELVRNQQVYPHQVYRESALSIHQNWLEHYRDQDKARAEKKAAKEAWEDYRYGVLWEVEHRPLSFCERAEVGTGSRKKWQPKLWAWEDWIEDQWSQRNQRERLAAQEETMAMLRRVSQALDVLEEQEQLEQEPDQDQPTEDEQTEEAQELDPQMGRSELPAGASPVVTRFQAQTLLVR